MTTYYIEDHLLSARVRVFVKGENMRPVLLLVGSWGVRGDSLSIYDLEDNRLAKVVQTSFSPNPKFDLYIKETKVGTLRRIISLRKDYYWISQINWLAKGNNRFKRYQINHFGKEILQAGIVRNEGKTYFKIDVSEKEDGPLCLCVLAVLDYWAKRNTHIEELSLSKKVLLQPLVNKCKNIKD